MSKGPVVDQSSEEKAAPGLPIAQKAGRGRFLEAELWLFEVQLLHLYAKALNRAEDELIGASCPLCVPVLFPPWTLKCIVA